MTPHRWLIVVFGAALLIGCTGDRVAWLPAEACFEFEAGDPPAGWRVAAFWSVALPSDAPIEQEAPVLAGDAPAVGRRACVTLEAPPPWLQSAARQSWDTVDFVWYQPTGPGRSREHLIATAPVVFVRWVPYLDADGDGALGGADPIGAPMSSEVYGLRIGYVVGFDHLLGLVHPTFRPYVWATIASPASPFVRTDAGYATPWNPVVGETLWSIEDCPRADQVRRCRRVLNQTNYDARGRWVDPRIDAARVGPSPTYQDVSIDVDLPLYRDIPSLPSDDADLEVLRTSRRCVAAGDLLIVESVRAFRLAPAESCLCERGQAVVLAITLASDPAHDFGCEAADFAEGEVAERLRTAAGLVMPDEEPMPEE